MDKVEQEHIVNELRRTLAHHPYSPLFDLPLAHPTLLPAPVVPVRPARQCGARARAEQESHGGVTVPVQRWPVHCVLARGHDGPHATESRPAPFHWHKWQTRQWER
jgi:hypothetical protein